MVKLYKNYSFHENLKYFFQILDYAKELFRCLKNEEEKILFKNLSMKYKIKKIFHSKNSSKNNFKKIITSNWNFSNFSKNQITYTKKIICDTLNKHSYIYRMKNVHNICSKFFKFNLFAFTKRELNGFINNHKFSKYSKLKIEVDSLVNIKKTFWNSIIFFLFFQIH